VAGIKRKAADGMAADSPASSASKDGVEQPRKVKNSALNDLKRKVLKKNPNLQALHHELVVSPNDPEHRITEKEFWEGREVSSRCHLHMLSCPCALVNCVHD
jgi:hypothetical protein